MKKLGIVIALGIVLVSCKSENKPEEKSGQETVTTTTEAPQTASPSGTLDWDNLPDLKDIGNFPFITAPKGLKINNEKDGVSEFFEFEKMENYTGKEVITTEGKLAILSFDGADGKDFNQRIFDKSVYDYLGKIGAMQLYKGEYPSDEAMIKKLNENMWNGKYRTAGLMKESESPFGVYAFKNNGRKYILNVQSNSAQGSIFLMELQDLEQTIEKYSAAQMKTDIEANGKAILNINFDTDKATLQPEGQETVDEIFVLLNDNKNLKISIEGHTDDTGTPQRNKQLSADRANTVLRYLTGKGIDVKRLKAAGFGSEKQLVPNNSEANKAKNRRVELVKV